MGRKQIQKGKAIGDWNNWVPDPIGCCIVMVFRNGILELQNDSDGSGPGRRWRFRTEGIKKYFQTCNYQYKRYGNEDLVQ